jgi:hypothetical protein
MFEEGLIAGLTSQLGNDALVEILYQPLGLMDRSVRVCLVTLRNASMSTNQAEKRKSHLNLFVCAAVYEAIQKDS